MLKEVKKTLAVLILLASICGLGWALYTLSGIVAPFILALGLAYLVNPLLEWVCRKAKLKRVVGVCLFFTFFFIVLGILLFWIVPILIHQLSRLVALIPVGIDWFQMHALPKLQTWWPLPLEALNLGSLKETALTHLPQASLSFVGLSQSLFKSTVSLAHNVLNLGILGVVSFYLMRDWPKFTQALLECIPVSYRSRVTRFCQESDEVLGAFLRGQLTVIVLLALFYALGLFLIGIEFSLLLGVSIGVFSLVPYLGGVLGLLTTCIVALIQMPDAFPVIWILALFGFGQILEGWVFTPLFVGDKLGLHPVAVIFAVLGGGQLLGVTGVLLALPITAILVVLIRHVRENYALIEASSQLNR